MIERYLPAGVPFYVWVNSEPFGVVWADDFTRAIEEARQAFKRERGRPPFSVTARPFVAEPLKTGDQP